MKYESDAMLEILKIKEELWQEVAHLPLEEAIRERFRKSEQTAKELGFFPVNRDSAGTKRDV